MKDQKAEQTQSEITKHLGFDVTPGDVLIVKKGGEVVAKPTVQKVKNYALYCVEHTEGQKITLCGAELRFYGQYATNAQSIIRGVEVEKGKER